MERFEYTGVWWIPNKCEVQFAGKLKFDPKHGGRLRLIQLFQGEMASPTDLSSGFRHIYGYIGNHRFVTLQGCSPTGLNGIPTHMKDFGLTVCEPIFTVDCIYISFFPHFHTEGELTFDELHASYTYLPDWLAEHSRYQKRETLSKPPSPITETHQIPFHNDAINVSFERSEFFPSGEAKVIISSQDNLHISHYLEFLNLHLADFLTFATGKDNYPFAVTGYVGHDAVQIYYQVSGFEDRVDEYFLDSEMSFTYENIQENLATYLSNWIGKRESLEEIYRLYFMPHYQTTRDEKAVFLFLAQALEAVHRRKYGGTYCERLEFRKIRKILIDAIPEFVTDEHREKLKSAIGAANQYSLKTRILDLLAQVSSNRSTGIIRHMINEVLGDDWNAYAVNVRDTRDYLSHYGDPTNHVLKNDELIDCIWRTQVVVQILFMLEMGFGDELIMLVLRDNSVNYLYLKLSKSLM